MKRVVILDYTAFGVGRIAGEYLLQFASDKVIVKWIQEIEKTRYSETYKAIIDGVLSEDHIDNNLEESPDMVGFKPDFSIHFGQVLPQKARSITDWYFPVADLQHQLDHTPDTLREQIKKDMLIFISRALS